MYIYICMYMHLYIPLRPGCWLSVGRATFASPFGWTATTFLRGGAAGRRGG